MRYIIISFKQTKTYYKFINNYNIKKVFTRNMFLKHNKYNKKFIKNPT